MPELNDLFAAADANKIAREAADQLDYDNGTFDFSPDTPEASGIYFIPEGDDRMVDKINFNLKKIIDTPTTPDYVTVTDDYTSKDNEFLLCDTTVTTAQKNEISAIAVLDNAPYTVTINGTPCLHTSVTVAQQNVLENFVVTDSTLYTATLNGIAASYTSLTTDAQVTTIDTITAVDSTLYEVTINGTLIGFTSGVGATIEEITAGLVLAINNEVLINTSVTATDLLGTFTVTSDVAGTSHIAVVTTGTMTATITTPNHLTTLVEIIDGLVISLNAAAQPVTITNNATSITVDANVGGTPFTLGVTAGTFTSTIIINNQNSSETSILIGIKDIINTNVGSVVTAVVIGQAIIVTADVPGVAFTMTSSDATITNLVPNKDGSIIVTLGTPLADNESIQILDIKSNFNIKNVILTSPVLIMGSSTDYNLTVNDSVSTILYVNGDWRVF
jgi:hypothetical protein